MGYDTTLKTNLGIDELEEEIDKFIVKLDNNRESEGFFWFAGHGLNIDGRHYLLAIDVNPRNNSTIARSSYSVDKLADIFERIKNKANLLVLDACRNNSFPGNRAINDKGQAVVSIDTVGNVIAYSTRAGQTADDGKEGDRNSPFAAAFLSNIKTAESFDNLFIQIANDTRTRTNGKQQPYKVGYFNIKNYSIALTPGSQPTPAPSLAVGTISLTSAIAGEILIDGQSTRAMIKANGTEIIHNVKTGDTQVAVKEENGAISTTQTVRVLQGQIVSAVIERPGHRLRTFEQRGSASQEMKADGLRAAHPSFPLSSRIKVTNTSNGKEIEATIIERIPASPNRIVDLSLDAWNALDLTPSDIIILSIAME